MKILAIEDSKLRNGYLHLVVYRNDTRLGVLKYQPQSTRGAEHEVTSFLADNGYIAKKYLTGYSMPKNLNIRILDIEWIIKGAIKEGVQLYY